MPESRNLASEITSQLPAELVSFIERAGRAAAESGQKLYMVGGVVRDLLLGRPNFDLDLVVEGNAISLARKLAAETTAKLTVHRAFNTTKLRWDLWSVDLTTVRSETYSRPGALPTVAPGTVQTDLFRRDFTINAMAIELTAGSYGKLHDLYGGTSDLQRRLIRVLHDLSFTDDATRMWRAIRYEQRLGFMIERGTRRLLVRDVPMFDTVSGDRIRHELELVFKEDHPERVLRRARELGVLAKLHPSLEAGTWLSLKFRQARSFKGDGPLVALYLALLAYPLNTEETGHLTDYLKLPRPAVQVLRDSLTLRSRLDRLAEPGLRPSGIYELLKDLSLPAIAANRLAADSPLARRRLGVFLDHLRHVQPILTGDDMISMGIKPGPHMKEILQGILAAKLDGKVKTREEEARMADRLRKEDPG